MQQLKLFNVQQELKRLGKEIFSAQDLAACFGANKRAIEAFLSYNYRVRKIQRVRRGLYFFTGENIDSFRLANLIYTPSYISLETALSYYSLIPEVVYAITSLTTRPTREFVFNDISYCYQTIKREAFTGYIAQELNGRKMFIATAEKALADYCYFLSMGKKSENDRVDLSKINLKKVKEYLTLFKKDNLMATAKKWLPNL